MAVVYINPWAKSVTPGGAVSSLVPQRSDLWQVDLSQVIQGLNAQKPSAIFQDGTQGTPDMLLDVPEYYAQSVSVPGLALVASEVRRGSVPFSTPGFDSALDAVRMSFIVDSGEDAKSSLVYKLLTTWMLYVRAGRGPRGSEPWIALGPDYTRKFKFDVTVSLLSGSSNTGAVLNRNTPNGLGTGAQELQVSTQLTLENLWLASFKISDLNYTTPAVTTIEATFYAENVKDTTNEIAQ